MSQQTIAIKGMHCRSCEITLEDALGQVSGVTSATVSLRYKTATVSGNPRPQAIKQAIESAGYSIGSERPSLLSRRPADYLNLVLGIAILVVAVYTLGALGIDSLGADIGTTPAVGPAALLIGVAAGLSTCMALIGSIVLGLSSRFATRHPQATTGQKFRPHLFFNLGRIIGFTLLGGLLALIGTLIGFSGWTLGLLTITVGVVMLVIGLQLTGISPRLSSVVLSLPVSIAKKLGVSRHQSAEYSHVRAAGMGVLTFFLPCGFTQAMQLLAISSGQFATGALIMGMFALGTTPGLLAIGGLTSVVKGAAARRFYKIAGVVVATMALYTIGNGFNLTGFQLPKWPANPVSQTVTSSSDDSTTLRTTYRLREDITPSSFTVKAGSTYTLLVDAKETGQGCMSTIMIPGLVDRPQFLVKNQTNKLTFAATRPGTYQITCAMGVPRGTLTIEP